MTPEELRDRLIGEGIESVLRDERMNENERRGSIAGFSACRTLATPEDFQRALQERELVERDLRRRKDLSAYWYHRFGTIQIEYVFDLLKVGWGFPLISARAGLRYARLVGVETGNPN